MLSIHSYSYYSFIHPFIYVTSSSKSTNTIHYINTATGIKQSTLIQPSFKPYSTTTELFNPQYKWLNLMCGNTRPKLLEVSYGWLVSWYFEPSHPQKDHIRAKTNFNLSLYSSHKSSNHKFPKNQKNQSWHRFTYSKTYTNVKHKNFEGLVSSVLLLFKST